MKKTYLALAITLAICLISTTAFAQSQLFAHIDDTGRVTVSIVTDGQADEIYMLYVLEPGYTAANYVDTAAQELSLFKLEQLAESKSINEQYSLVEHSFQMRQTDKKGEYTVIAAGGDFSGAQAINTQYFVFADPDDTAQALAELKAATAANAEQVLTKYQAAAWHVDMQAEIYAAQKNVVLANLLSICKDIERAEQVQKAFLVACELTELRYAQKEEVFDLFNRYEYDFAMTYCDEIIEKDSAFLDAFVSLKAENAANPMTNLNELAAVIRRSQALSAVNKANRDTIISVIEQYNDIFEVDFSGDFKKVSAYEVAKKILPTAGKEFKAIREVLTAFNTAVSQLLSSDGGGGGATGGVGGGTQGMGLSGGAAVPVKDIVNELSPRESTAFFDVDDTFWAAPHIEYLNFKGIMTGGGDGSFRPNQYITREEFIKTLLMALKIELDQTNNAMDFQDVSQGAWYYQYIITAQNAGITGGISEEIFGIGMPIIRQDAAAMVIRAMNYANKAFPNVGDTVSFTDSDAIADYAKGAVTTLQKAEVLSGYEDGEFKPANKITRAETAKIVYSVLLKLGAL